MTVVQICLSSQLLWILRPANVLTVDGGFENRVAVVKGDGGDGDSSDNSSADGDEDEE